MISVGTVHIWCTDIQASKIVIHIKLLRSKQGGQSQTGWHGGGVERSMRVEGWRSEEKRMADQVTGEQLIFRVHR